LVRDDQLSLAIGRRGQNVRLASKLVGWDIEIMTAEELDEVIEKAVKAFEKIEVVDTELAERLVEQGILSYDDLSVMEIADLVNTIEGLNEEQAVEIVARAETLAEENRRSYPGVKARGRLPRRPPLRRAVPSRQALRIPRSETRPTWRPPQRFSIPRPWKTVRPRPPHRPARPRADQHWMMASIRSVTRPATTRSMILPWRLRHPASRRMVTK
jgi:transcription termination factor NusA